MADSVPTTGNYKKKTMNLCLVDNIFISNILVSLNGEIHAIENLLVKEW